MSNPRARKFFRWFLALLVGLGGLISAGAGFFLLQASRAKLALADYLASHPESSAIVAYTIDENGTVVEDGYSVFHNADQPFIMGSTMKLIVLAAYADAVASGDLDPDEQIAVADWDAYYLPAADGGAHSLGLQGLGLKVDAHGFAQDQAARVRLDDIARMMMHNSDNASTDYLRARLGPERIAAVMRETGMESHTPIYSLAGTTLLFANHEQPIAAIEEIQPDLEALAAGDSSRIDELEARYLHDPAWRSAQIAYLTTPGETSAPDLATIWPLQSEFSKLFPTSTAREYARFMALLAGGSLISPSVSAIMAEKIEGVPSDAPLRLLFFDRYGAKDGVTAGVLTLASYGVPKRGGLGGQTRVVVILTNALPYQAWQNALQGQAIYLMQVDLARATGVFEQFNIDN
jgi:D-alanyl-D-alanine carboxypeptidase